MSEQQSLPLTRFPVCPTCGRKDVEYHHTLNAGLVRGLEALARAGGRSKLVDLKLTLSQSNNFQKLQYWELVRRLTKGGMWEITEKGRLFIENKSPAPQSVWTYQGEVVRSDSNFIYARNVKGFYRQREDYAGDAIAR